MYGTEKGSARAHCSSTSRAAVCYIKTTGDESGIICTYHICWLKKSPQPSLHAISRFWRKLFCQNRSINPRKAIRSHFHSNKVRRDCTCERSFQAKVLHHWSVNAHLIDWKWKETVLIACENSRPSSLPAQVAFRVIYRRKFPTDDVNLSRIWSWALIGSIGNYA